MWKLVGLTLLLLLGTVVIVQAQAETCPAIVEEALTPLGELCNPLDRNSACYGATMVESTTFTEPRPADFFAAPGDRAELGLLREIHPKPLDVATNTFGVAVLNLQANLPNTVPGQAVIFLLSGNARLTNEVPQDSTRASPFQSFYFLPGLGQSECYEAEPMLTIQTPGNITVTITLNGALTEMSPGTLLTITPTVCTIHRGNIIQGTGDNRPALLANQTVDIRIEPTGRIVVNNLRNISDREFERGQQIQEVLNSLAEANGWQEQFIVPRQTFDAEPTTPASTPEATSSSPCDVQHTVANGETLHRIARQYNTSVLGIAEANQVADPRRIYVGQVLCIPNPGSGFQALPAGQ
jgi:LysM repeat protein